eukprot:1190965-Prorocentrum_minimum.AAC.3
MHHMRPALNFRTLTINLPSTSTGAVNHLVQVLGLHVPLPVGADDSLRPVVFVGPYEHHSNLLPWRESCALVVQPGACSTFTRGRRFHAWLKVHMSPQIPEDSLGHIDVAALKRELSAHKHRVLR